MLLLPETSPADMASETRLNASGKAHYRRRTRKDLWDRRTAAWRERCAWVTRYVEEFGGDPSVSPALRLRVERVAELQVLAWKARADCATGDISVDDMVRAQRLADHAENRLRGSIMRHGPAAPSLEEIKARHRQDAEEAARASRRAAAAVTARQVAEDVPSRVGAPSAVPAAPGDGRGGAE